MGVKNVNWNRITNKNVIKQKFPSYTIIFPIHILIIPRGASHDESTALTGLNILFIWIVVSNNTFINYSQAGKTSIPQLYNSLSYWKYCCCILFNSSTVLVNLYPQVHHLSLFLYWHWQHCRLHFWYAYLLFSNLNSLILFILSSSTFSSIKYFFQWFIIILLQNGQYLRFQ